VNLTPGTRIGGYEILASLGTGGMGQVYRAHDTKLGRDVAIKVLLPVVANIPDRLARFEREARTLAALNHPHIAHLYGLEQSHDLEVGPFLVLELVEGLTLADRITRAPIPLNEALSIAKQIAEALETAHEQGIVHRDLKPANIKVRADGTVKVLDFGLAKAIEPPGTLSARASEPMTAEMTEAGVILGTAAYMSPEQASGKFVDKRTDLWAFGVVLLEMLSGRRVFEGETTAHVLAAVLTKEPDWTALPADTPGQVRKLLRRCLEKDPKQRLPDAAVIRLEIEDVIAGPVVEAGPARAPYRASVAIGLLLGGALVAALATRALTRSATPAAPVTRLTITTSSAVPPSTALDPTARDFAVAPDGSFVVYRAGDEGQLVVRWLDRLDGVPLPGVSDARMPFVSPDSRWIGFVEGDGTIRKVAVSGGSPITLARLSGPMFPRGLSWVDDATIIAGTNSPASGLMRLAAGGGEPAALTIPDSTKGEVGHLLPSGLPDGRSVLFTIGAAQPEDTQIAMLDLQTKVYTPVLRGGRDAQYLASGHLLFLDTRSSAMSAVRFDIARQAAVGEPVRVLDRIGLGPSGALNAVATPAGMLVYVSGDMSNGVERTLAWVDRKGRETPVPAPPRAYASARLSPDGQRIAVGIDDEERDVWIFELARQTLTRLTFDPDIDIVPVWTPDGRRVIFASKRAGTYNLFARAVDGAAVDVRLTTSANVQVPNSVTPDGAYVIGHEVRPKTTADLVRIMLPGVENRPAPPVEAEPLATTTFEEWNGEVSPNGRFIAYQSAETGRLEVFVRPYPDMSTARWQVSAGGGAQPAWTRGGKELIYVNPESHLMAVPVDIAAAAFRAGTPDRVATTAYAPINWPWRTYDVSPDGQRFLILKDRAGSSGKIGTSNFVVVQNWFEELKRALPAK
jgi:eukaryotic-like serine/threonine-protein kinase